MELTFVRAVPNSRDNGLLPYDEIVEALIAAADTETPWAEFEVNAKDADKIVRTFKQNEGATLEVHTRRAPSADKRLIYVKAQSKDRFDAPKPTGA